MIAGTVDRTGCGQRRHRKPFVSRILAAHEAAAASTHFSDDAAIASGGA
jgi:hypothetical protein